MSVLSELAATLSAGQAAVLCTDNDSSNYGRYPAGCFPQMEDVTGNGDPSLYYKCFDFMSSAVYDSVRHRVHAKGGGHIPDWDGSPLDRALGHELYDIPTHLWHLIPRTAYDNEGGSSNIHGYRRNALASDSQQFFFAEANTGLMRVCDINVETANIPTGFDDDSWADHWNLGAGGTERGPIDYFPDRDTLLWHQSGSGQVLERARTGGSASLILTDTDYATDGVGQLYSPKHRVVLMGGGNIAPRDNWRLYNADGSFTTCAQAPDYPMYFVSTSLLSVCPINGEFIVWTVEDDGDEYPARVVTYHPITDTWTRREDIEATFNALGEESFPFWPGSLRWFNAVCVPISDEGVTMFMSSNVLIYRHSVAPAERHLLPWAVRRAS